MQSKFTIIYAYRNRDVERVRLSLRSLKNQSTQNFEVLFIDYGSTDDFTQKVKMIMNEFSFVTYHYIAHEGLLWNKSKALNYGISKTNSEYIVISDVDVLFASDFVKQLENLANPNQFSLFKISYLPQEISSETIETKAFNELKSTHSGDTFGIGLFPKKALEKVKGLDTFFHFYGSEDEDLNNRLISAGYTFNRCEDFLLLHQWHPRYPKKKDQKLTVIPRLSNIQRINQRHFLWQKEMNIKMPYRSKNWSRCYSKIDYEVLKQPHKSIVINNLKAQVIHFLNHELSASSGTIIKVVFKEDEYYNSSKYKVKKILNVHMQTYLTLKEINDLLLEKIIFEYKDFNYSYVISKNLDKIEFTIDLRNI